MTDEMGAAGRRSAVSDGVPPRQEMVLDDIWANEGGVSVRVIADAKGDLRIEFTRGVNERAEHIATLVGFRAHRLGQVLAKTWPKPGQARR